MKRQLVVGFIALLAFVAFAATPAHAQATRTWVSGVGDDANPCSRTAPCKTFAGAISKTAPSGEINVLDPGGFGALTITKPITVRNDGVGTAGVLVSGTNGFVVAVPNATDTVIIRGLDFEGLGTGINGVLVNTGGNVFIENCTINNFITAGINFTPSVAGSQLHVANTYVRNNGTLPTTGEGINIGPTVAATASLVNTYVDHNIAGLKITTGTGMVTVANSEASNNNFAGWSAGVSGAVLNIEKSISASNGTGVTCAAGSTVRMGSMGIFNNGTALGGTCSSFKNNDIDTAVTVTGISPQ